MAVMQERIGVDHTAAEVRQHRTVCRKHDVDSDTNSCIYCTSFISSGPVRSGPDAWRRELLTTCLQYQLIESI